MADRSETGKSELLSRGLFVFGTDTGVGKTVAAAALGLGLESLGHGPVAVMKPVETGCRRGRSGRLVARDARFHGRMLSLPDDEDLCPVRLSHPLAPLTASKMEGRPIRKSDWYPSFRRLVKRFPFLLVEGAGGVMVPVSRNCLMSDLGRMTGLPCVVVARTGLGTINHTLLSVEHLRSKGIPVLGLIFNRGERSARIGYDEQTGPALAAHLAGLPVLGTLPHLQSMERGALIRMGKKPASRLLDLLEDNA